MEAATQQPKRVRKKKKSTRGKGRPPKYHDQLAKSLCEMAAKGATDQEMARAIGVDVRTFYTWKARHADFNAALRASKSIADDMAEIALFQRAVGFSHQAIKFFCHEGCIISEEYTEQYAPDVGALTLWLKNRRPDKWRDTKQLEHTGKDGAPIGATITLEQARVIILGDYATNPAPMAKVEDL